MTRDAHEVSRQGLPACGLTSFAAEEVQVYVLDLTVDGFRRRLPMVREGQSAFAAVPSRSIGSSRLGN